MKLESLGPFEMVEKLPGAEAKRPGEAAAGFVKALNKAVGAVEAAHKKADSEIQGLAAGRHNRLHETMMAVEEADLSLKLLLQVRNKALEAYREIMRISV